MQAETVYNAAGQVIAQIDSLGNKTKFEYDAFGRKTAQIDALGYKTQFVYNNIGELIEQIDPLGHSTKFEYDNFGRQVKTILPAAKNSGTNPIQETVYNALGQIVKQVDPLGHTALMEYDGSGRVVRQVNAEGGVTCFTYNKQGLLQSLTDPVGNTTSYQYDEQGRLLEETNELGKSRYFEYLAGNILAKKTDRNGRVISFEYDNFGQRIAEKWYENNNIIKTLVYIYNESGQLVSVTDGVSTFDYTRDEDGRETIASVLLQGLNSPVVLETQYDALGRKVRNTVNYNSKTDTENIYTYSKTGQVLSIIQGGKRVDYRYNAGGMRTSTVLAQNGKEVATVTQSYDGSGRLESIVQKSGRQTIAEYLYAWDAANRITGMQTLDDKADYGYDKTSQLVSAGYEKLPSEQYNYDANGNRKNFVTGKNNLLTSDGEFCYTYDGEGNRITKVAVSGRAKTEYHWDHRNRLVRVVDNSKTVEYHYDYLNRLVRRNDEFFVHDGWQIVCSLTNRKVGHRYLWGSVQDELLAVDDKWVLKDHLNTVRNVINSKGKIVSHLEYNAFGKLLNVKGEKPSFRYTGKLFDDDTGLQWNINRWYDANVGRWINEDPIGFKGKDNNLFRYVISNPIRYNDLFGLISKCSSKFDIGNRWGSAAVVYSGGEKNVNTAWALLGSNPGNFENFFNIAIILAAIAAASGVMDPELTLADILTGGDGVPTGAKVAALLGQLKELVKNRMTFELWVEYSCYECKCRTTTQWLAGIKENPNWQLAETKWEKCDLTKTSIGYLDIGGVFLSDVKLSDLPVIESECRTQLAPQVDELCKK